MKKKRGKPGRHSRETAAPVPLPISGWIAIFGLAIALAGAGLAIDSGADASFDAPKRFFALLGIGIAAGAAFWTARPVFRELRSRSDFAKGTAILLAVALLLALFSALLSPRRVTALQTLRLQLLYVLLLPLGAASFFVRGRRLLLSLFLTLAAINSVVSVLQAQNLFQPFALKSHGGREATGAYIGNPGSMALTAAFAAVACLAVALFPNRIRLRILCAGGATLFFAALLVNQNLTGWSALGTGTVLLLVARFGRRSILPLLAAAVLASAAMAAYPPMRERAAQTIANIRARNWDAMLSYRLGPWSAAVRIFLERPWLGFGPGTFESEFVPHRLAAELAARRRLVNPLLTSSYGEAHCDYLQPFAEVGAPAAVAAIAAALFTGGTLARHSRRLEGSRRAEAALLLALLAAGAAAAATWFPFQRPITALPLLLALGRAWRLAEEEGPAA